jgi:DNA-binding CsgD family transcriptional regulator/tetratricopeptide (TPR) repeat protein
MANSVELGRRAFDAQDWAEARTRLAAAELSDPEDLERLAVAAYLVGHDDESRAALERACRVAEQSGDRDRAARSAVWLGLTLFLQGEAARAGGWLARAERMMHDTGRSCAARGLMLVPRFLEVLSGGDGLAAEAVAEEIIEIGTRCDDRDVVAFGLLCHGEALLARTEITRGMKLFDEAMVSVTTGEISPIVTGIIYCAVIESCMRVFDLRRAAEWTRALHAWCEAQPDLVPYRGQCLVHRSQVLQAHGTWDDSLAEALRARQQLSAPVHPALGLACYQQGELLRLRGEFPGAERAYRAAAEHGYEPAPGLALLRLAEGNIDAARAAITRLVAEQAEPFGRAVMLGAAVDILLAANDVRAASEAASELREIATGSRIPFFDALAAYARGCSLLADGDAPAALPALRHAYASWNDAALVYEAARARVQVARACDALGDEDTARIELDAARGVFARLGAQPDVSRIDALTAPAASRTAGGLTDREVQVLRLVAMGKTNRAIAAELVISEHTVARHIQNIFRKLDLPSRAAATAYAFEHGLA